MLAPGAYMAEVHPIAQIGATMTDANLTILTSDLRCPHCGHRESLVMPTDACLFFHECTACHSIIRPNAGDCCVFCSFGSVVCPPMQGGASDCCVPAPTRHSRARGGGLFAIPARDIAR